MSSNLYYAAHSSIGAGAEVTYGSAVARTVWAYIVSANCRLNLTKKDRETLRSSATSFNSYGNFITKAGWSGNVTLDCTYDNMGMWLKQWIGSSATTGPVGSIYQHTFKRALAFPTGLTLEINRGTTCKDLFTGGKVFRGTMSQDCDNGMPPRLSMDFVGTTFARSDGVASITGRTNDTVLMYSDASGTPGNINWNSITPQWKNYTLSVENGLSERMYNGSLYTLEPLRDGKEVITFQSTVQVTDALMDAYIADSQADLTITYNDPNSLKLWVTTVHNAKIVDIMDSQIDHMGMLMSTVTWKGFTNGTNDGVSFIIDNLTSTATANG